MFALFINSFRQEEQRWPIEYLNNWSNLTAFVSNSPSTKELCLELQRLKKVVTRPHLTGIQEEVY